MNYPSITLWSDSSFFSPYAMSAYVALTEKGIPFQLKRVEFVAESAIRRGLPRAVADLPGPDPAD